MRKKKTQAKRSKRFIKIARKLGVDGTEGGHELAFKGWLKKQKTG